jgi:hypothetical protein
MILFIFTGIQEKANYPLLKPVLAKAGIRNFINNLITYRSIDLSFSGRKVYAWSLESGKSLARGGGK